MLRPMNWRVIIVYLVGYVFVDWVSYVHPVLPLGITPWNPPPSLSLFLLLFFGQRYWPWLFVSALAADVVVRGVPAPWFTLIAAAVLVTAIYALAAQVLRRQLQAPPQLVTGRDLGRFLVVVTTATFLVAVGYVAIFTLTGRVSTVDFVPNMFRHWVGDLNGILVFTPALLVHADTKRWRRRWRPEEWVEIAGQTISIALALWVVFGPVAGDEFKFFYLLFLPLIWIATRWALPGATLGLLVIQLGLIAAIQAGGYHAATFVQFQFLMLALCVTGLALGATVTQRRRVEAELRNKQAALNRALQFAAAGEMTSALAHELNQPITAISNYLKACQSMLEQSEPDRELVGGTMEKAVAQARRAGAVVHRLRDFFRKGEIRPERVRVERLIDDAVQAVHQRAEQAHIRIRINIAPQLPVLQADPTQIVMVLHNLLANAVDEITLSQTAKREIRVSAWFDDGQIVVTVEDTGAGVAADIDEQIFEPFMTSKAEGMGMGLGISRSLVRAHGGDLVHDTSFESGARFILTLPLTPRATKA